MPYYFNKKKGKPAAHPKPRKVNYVDKLDKVFSLYIRVRDAMPNGMIRCISCGQVKPFDHFDCGHFYSRTHMATRYDEDNSHAECSACNRFVADHLIGYRENLIKKIGIQRFQLLEVKAHSTHKKDDFELKTLIDYYKKETERLKKLKGIR